MYAVDWAPKARRQLAKIRDPGLRLRIFEAVGRLRDFPALPGGRGLEKLQSHRYGYRYRIGDHRALVDIDSRTQTILVQEIRKRDERTY